ncbi:MAG TPA: hypothetical protein DCM28_24135 [Phycisphaerales bacterium]|nr:hypothetical protein [Phycisphaerales bacterium]HCD34551.1 hypothetical protein [Phycisphaerales bacterium]|tara:strand:+ start:840 stop:1244 length:405 start_codon:yes stop_codon:yes gene_type:complete
MKSKIYSLILLFALAVLVAVPGCSSGAPVSNVVAKKGTEVTLVRETVKVEPRRVVEQTHSTLSQLRLQDIKPNQTAVDAVFEFSSARGRNYRLIVTGVALNRTRIEIIGLKDYVDKEQAKLIYQEIERNLFVSR